MSALECTINRYLATWNESDPERRRALIAETWAEDGSYVDPLMAGDGHDGINAMVQGVQDQYLGFRFRRTSDLDAHHDRVRFSWEVGLEGGSPLAGGVDFAVIAGDRLRAVTGFLDFAPSPNGN